MWRIASGRLRMAELGRVFCDKVVQHITEAEVEFWRGKKHETVL